MYQEDSELEILCKVISAIGVKVKFHDRLLDITQGKISANFSIPSIHKMFSLITYTEVHFTRK